MPPCHCCGGGLIYTLSNACCCEQKNLAGITYVWDGWKSSPLKYKLLKLSSRSDVRSQISQKKRFTMEFSFQSPTVVDLWIFRLSKKMTSQSPELEEFLFIRLVLQIVFKNTASRPYSLHLHGVYDRTMASSAPQGVELREDEGPGDPVPPGEERIYNWRITKRQGPSSKDFDCKAGAYYSTVNMVCNIAAVIVCTLLVQRATWRKCSTFMTMLIKAKFHRHHLSLKRFLDQSWCQAETKVKWHFPGRFSFKYFVIIDFMAQCTFF